MRVYPCVCAAESRHGSALSPPPPRTATNPSTGVSIYDDCFSGGNVGIGFAVPSNIVKTVVAQLEKADTAGIEPMAHPLEDQVQRLRPDTTTSPNARDLYQRNAPQVEGGAYLVPKVIE